MATSAFSIQLYLIYAVLLLYFSYELWVFDTIPKFDSFYFHFDLLKYLHSNENKKKYGYKTNLIAYGGLKLPNTIMILLREIWNAMNRRFGARIFKHFWWLAVEFINSCVLTKWIVKRSNNNGQSTKYCKFKTNLLENILI